jgi:colanic acid/amylovoran biosynthesis glycosyltransferase
MLTMFHANPAVLDDGMFVVDRKSLQGMQRYAEDLDVPITAVHARLLPEERMMDPVRVPVATLPYRVEVVDTDAVWRLAPHELPRVRRWIAASTLIYHGSFNVGPLCAALDVPEALVAEFDVRSTVKSATLEARNPVVKLVRGVRALRDHLALLPSFRRAWSVHCNGYPVFDELASVNPQRRLLFLDSRMTEDLVIDETRLERRLAARPSQRLRLLYSGRYEAMKGAVDVVRLGLACIDRGMDIELHLYGQGRQAEAMRQLASAAGSRIRVHDAVSYPELVALSRDFDVFVCCHVQNDPSCTYLESFGSGLPIVGYANRMWRGLRRASSVGMQGPLGRIEPLVDALQRYLDEPELLARDARAARRFALEHSFEKEFSKRTADLRRMLAQAERKAQAQAA